MGYVPPRFILTPRILTEKERDGLRNAWEGEYGFDRCGPPHLLPPSRYIPAPPRARSYTGEGQAVARIIMAVGAAMIALALSLLR